MSKGSIINFNILVLPSAGFTEFILSLYDSDEVPANILKIWEQWGKDISRKKILAIKKCSGSSGKYLEKLRELELKTPDLVERKVKDSSDCARQDSCHNSNLDYFLELSDLYWVSKKLTEHRKQNRDAPYLHEFLQNSKIVIPENEDIPRNPILEARCEELRKKFEEKSYFEMTKNVDSTRKEAPEDSISYQIKSLNRQLIAILQFVFSVVTGFAFGFLGVELIVGTLDFGFRLLLGIMCALTIALAEIYFLAKKLNEYDEVESNLRKDAKQHIN